MDVKEPTRRSSSTTERKRESFQHRDDSFKSLQNSFEGKESRDESRDSRGSTVALGSPRIPRKFITNWRQACDRTRDRTKELLKRWRTLPDSETPDTPHNGHGAVHSPGQGPGHADKEHGWSVHVWATWVRRVPSEEDSTQNSELWKNHLSTLQKEKFAYFFSHLLDWDRDDVISIQDFDAMSERLRHFADWSTNSAEFHILHEVQYGFIDTFITNRITSISSAESMEDLPPGTTNLEQWLMKWSELVNKAQTLSDFPIWLQYFGKIIFLVINKSNTGTISRDELREFYSSFMGFSTQIVGEILDLAYNNMTANGDHPLCYPIFHLCFANFLLGKYPHGPGQFLFGPCQVGTYSIMFPIDYSAFNSPPDALEQYSPHKKSNRHSVVV
ncbi:hypothetical protein R5R35_011291 [Gryllus longicercus]|uniref:Sarcoplasmic calcium-binding protein n=1 Tax=Gryllus longicercus TaxID=2509291 RepID=A0AAN9VGS4_9ORTH